MHTHSEVLNMHLEMQAHLKKLERIQARRMLAAPEVPTGFGDDLAPIVRDRLKLGRGPLVQLPDFEETQ